MQPNMEEGGGTRLPTALAELLRGNAEDKEFDGF